MTDAKRLLDDAPEATTKAGQDMERWLREPADYEWGRKVTSAILAIEDEVRAEYAPVVDALTALVEDDTIPNGWADARAALARLRGAS